MLPATCRGMASAISFPAGGEPTDVAPAVCGGCSFLRDFAETWLGGEWMRLDQGVRKPVDQDVVTLLWEAECLQDRNLSTASKLPSRPTCAHLLLVGDHLWVERD